VIITNC